MSAVTQDEHIAARITSTRSIFPELTLDRAVLRWEDYLGELTPWELHKGIWFKRDDYFAPLGYGGPNGSKMRQLTWYMTRSAEGKTHVLTGASIQSPQLSMSAIVGRHLGLPTREVVYSKPHTVLTHPNPYIAAGFGAVFEYASGPYNPIIQRHVQSLRRPDSLYVEYGISVDHKSNPPELVRKFHEVGAHQVSNLPPEITRLIVPAGSCNSLTSVLLGLSRNSGNVQELFTLGIGPPKGEWLMERMAVLGIERKHLDFRWRHFSLHDTGYASYGDKFKGEHCGSIAFHPTYEAKMWRWLNENSELTADDHTGFWIVGSEANLKVVEPFFTQ